ncbi:MAG TPA: Beta-galactosidase C-terminal domain, partial [Microbacterium sp.]|nr:Beta-galactosidase C-terminal domain [Microbacterium sp.]
GVGWYVRTRLDPAGMRTLLHSVYTDAGVAAASHPEGLEVIARRTDDATYLVAVNHRDDDASFAATGTDLVTGTAVDGTATVPAGGVAVIRTTTD